MSFTTIWTCGPGTITNPGGVCYLWPFFPANPPYFFNGVYSVFNNVSQVKGLPDSLPYIFSIVPQAQAFPYGLPPSITYGIPSGLSLVQSDPVGGVRTVAMVGTPSATVGTYAFMLSISDTPYLVGSYYGNVLTEIINVIISTPFSVSASGFPGAAGSPFSGGNWTVGRTTTFATINTSPGTSCLFSVNASDIYGQKHWLSPSTSSPASSCTISGTPPASRILNWVVSGKIVQNGFYDHLPYTVFSASTASEQVGIQPPFAITNVDLPPWTSGVPFNSPPTHFITGSLGTPPISYTLQWLENPSYFSGVHISTPGPSAWSNQQTTYIYGTPTNLLAAAYPFDGIITATDATGNVTTQAILWTINPAPHYTTTSVPDAVVGILYSYTISISGGTAPFTYSVLSGSLPPGLSYTNPSHPGVLYGTPTLAGSPYSFTLKAVDSAGVSCTQAFSMTVEAALAITTPSLPNWTKGQAYSQTVAHSTDTYTPITLSLFSGALPTGVGGLPNTTGLINGTPKTIGTYTFQLQVHDSHGPIQYSTPRQFKIVINDVPTITGASMGTWTADYYFSYSLLSSVANGTPPFVFSGSTGSSGLTLDPAGVLYGPPSSAGSPYSFNITATDAAGASTSGIFTLAVNPAIVITPASLPAWDNNQAGYSVSMLSSGGTGSITWSSTGLPSGLSLNPSSGLLNGTPVGTGSYSVTIAATDSIGASTTNDYTLYINNNPHVGTGRLLPSTTVGLLYEKPLVDYGTQPFSFTPPSGIYPPGLVAHSDGNLYGVPTTPGTYTFGYSATDNLWVISDSGSATITINKAISFSPASLSNWTIGLSGYSQTVFATGGTTLIGGPGLTMVVSSGSLPPGLTFVAGSSSSAVISGTPTAVGSSTFTITATDAVGASNSITYTVVVNTHLTLSQPSSSGIVGTTYSSKVASGGTTPLNYLITNGILPPGLSLNSSTGVLSGTPTAGGTYSFTLTVTDSAGMRLSEKCSIVISKLDTIISWNIIPTHGNIPYPTPLGGNQLDAVASNPGTLIYNPPAGTVLPAGPNQVLSVSFIPSNPLAYNPAVATVTIDVYSTAPEIINS